MPYKLTYFNARGKAEPIRLLFAQAGVEYEDHRIEKEEWPAVKPNTPFGQIPVLEVDGVKLCQSNAIARYVAKKFHLAGKTELEQAQVDMLIDCFEDATKPVFGFMLESDEAKKTVLKTKYIDEQLPGYLTSIENLLKHNHGGDGFFVGTELTWADIAFAHFVGRASMVSKDDFLTKFPKLQALKNRVEDQPKIKEWIKKRPVTER